MPVDVKRLRDMAGLLRLMDQHAGHRESHEAAASLLEKAADEIERKDRALDHPLLRELFGAIEDSDTPEAARLWAMCMAWFDVRDAALSPATPREEMSNDRK